MKLSELFESIDFVPSFLKNQNGETYYTSPMKDIEQECWYCDGTKLDGDHPCSRCNGKGTTTEKEYDCPYMNVSNQNGYLILQMLGIEPDSVGMIQHQDLPNIKRRLIQIINSDREQQQHVRPDVISQRPATRTVTNVDGIPTIGMQGGGPKMYEFGVDVERVKNYAQRFMELVDYAQQKGWGIGWA